LVRVLFADVYYDDGAGKVFGPGYIHVKDGVILGYGEGEPPEELSLAELVISGEALVVFPGPALALVAVELYPFRSILGGRLKAENLLFKPDKCVRMILEQLRGDAAYYSALMAFHELAVNGVTRVYPLAFNPSEVGKALKDSGLDGVVLVPKGCALEAGSVEGVPGGIEALELSCKREGRAWLEQERMCINNMCVNLDEPPVHFEPWISPWHRMLDHGFKGYMGYIREGHKMFEKEYEPFKGKAYLVAIDVGEPPGWVPDPKYAKAWTLGSRVRVDTVISSGNIVVDGGEMLSIGRDIARKASERIREVVERIRDACEESV
jgi:hypothetical protein